MSPHHVGAIEFAGVPSACGASRDCVDNILHRGIDALSPKRGHRLIGNAARHQPLEPVVVDIDIEREAMKRAAALDAHTDRGDLAGLWRVGVKPDAGVPVISRRFGKPEVSQRLDQKVLDRRNKLRGVGKPTAAPGHVKNRISDELARCMHGDIATAVDFTDNGIDSGRIDQDIGRITTATEGEHRWVFQEQQVIAAAALQLQLQRVGLVVGNATEPSNTEWLMVFAGHRSGRQRGCVTEALLPSHGFR